MYIRSILAINKNLNLNAENTGKEGQPINRMSSVNSHLACDLLLDEEKSIRYKSDFW